LLSLFGDAGLAKWRPSAVFRAGAPSPESDGPSAMLSGRAFARDRQKKKPPGGGFSALGWAVD
jgi:hypothetical protein